MMSLSWSQGLAWRMRQQLLDPVGTESVAGVVSRLGAVPSQFDAAAELAVRTRRQRSRSGEVARALADGRIIKTFAFRGATHLMSAEDGGAYLALRAASRMWELPSWQSYYELTPADWPALRETVRDALVRRTADPGRARRGGHRRAQVPAPGLRVRRTVRHPAEAARLAGRHELRSVARRTRRPSSGWTATRAGPACLTSTRLGCMQCEAYFREYGPATADHAYYWLGDGLGAGRKRIRVLDRGLGDHLAAVDIDGGSALRPA